MPKEVRTQLNLEHGERVLAADQDVAGHWWVATHLALHVPVEALPANSELGEPSGSAYRRLRWERIDKASWDRDSDALRVAETATFGQVLPTVSARFARAGHTFGRGLLGVIRERVTASIVVNRHVPLYGQQGVRVIARRRPGSADPLEWSMAFDDQLDPAEPQVLADAERAIASIRDQVES